MDNKAPGSTFRLVVTIVWGLLLVPGLGALLTAPMLFDTPGSAEQPHTYLMILLAFLFPVLCIASIVGTWVLWSRQKRSPHPSFTVAQIIVGCLPLIPTAVVVLGLIFMGVARR
jgi:hypothetical protein